MKQLLFFSIIFVALSSNAQIELNKETTKETKKTKKKEEISEDSDKQRSTDVFFQGNWSFTNRKLEPNDGLFGDSLGERAKELGVGAWGAGVGLRSVINQWLTWEGGISFFQNGETYDYQDELSDSSYSYTNNYMYIGMPIKLYFTYGDKWQLMAGVGVVPQMFLQYRQTSHYTAMDGTASEEEKLKTKIGYNSFVISAAFNLGVKYQVSDRVGLYFIPEYKHQLTSSYSKISSYKHFGRSLGANFGLSIAF